VTNNRVSEQDWTRKARAAQRCASDGSLSFASSPATKRSHEKEQEPRFRKPEYPVERRGNGKSGHVLAQEQQSTIPCNWDAR